MSFISSASRRRVPAFVVSSLAAGLLLAAASSATATTFTGSGAITTDYVWRGTTQTQGDPAVQAGFKVTADNGLYGAIWGSNVEFAPETKASSEIDVTVGVQKGEQLASADEKGLAASQGPVGLTLRALTPDEQRQIESHGGLLVERASGAAARAGIRPGDVVLSVNGEPVSNVAQARALLAKSSKRAALLVQRDDVRLFVPVDIG